MPAAQFFSLTFFKTFYIRSIPSTYATCVYLITYIQLFNVFTPYTRVLYPYYISSKEPMIDLFLMFSSIYYSDLIRCQRFLLNTHRNHINRPTRNSLPQHSFTFHTIKQSKRFYLYINFTLDNSSVFSNLLDLSSYHQYFGTDLFTRICLKPTLESVFDVVLAIIVMSSLDFSFFNYPCVQPITGLHKIITV